MTESKKRSDGQREKDAKKFRDRLISAKEQLYGRSLTPNEIGEISRDAQQIFEKLDYPD